MTTKFIQACALAVIAALSLASVGCDGGHEGDRCNPSLSHDECNDGLSCQTPSTCVENYCCPSNASSSTNPYCNGTLCPASPAPDGGTSDLDAGVD